MLMPLFVKLPRHDQIPEASQYFTVERSMPKCVGAIDGCQIAIPKPTEHGSDYWNRKSYSINMQADVDNSRKYVLNVFFNSYYIINYFRLF